MSERTFVPWVAPAAQGLRESRRQIAEWARTMPADAWPKPSPDDGWTYKDLLGHLAVGDWLFQSMLSAVTAGEAFEMPAMEHVNEVNAQHRKELAGHSVDQLIAGVAAEGEETQELLSRLTEAHEGERLGPVGLGDWVRGFSRHDTIHLAELRTAVDQ